MDISSKDNFNMNQYNTQKSIEEFILDNKASITLKSQCILQSSHIINDSLTTEHNANSYDECIKHLNPNAIVSGVIVNITYEDSSSKRKKQGIILKLKQILSIVICLNGENEDYSPNVQLDGNIEAYSLTGVINPEDIYDKQMIHLNELIDSNICIGNEITAMIISISHNKDKALNTCQGTSTNASALIELSLRNSLIKGKKQTFIDSKDHMLHIPFTLGMPIKPSNEERNEAYLKNKISQYDIKEYGLTVNGANDMACNVSNAFSGFNYEILRKMQNYDWSDEYISKGDYYAEKGLFILAIENYDEAEKLDPLNTDVYLKKGDACLKMDDMKKALNCYKNCLKIDPKNPQAREYIEKIHSNANGNGNSNGTGGITASYKRLTSNKNTGNEEAFLNKKRRFDR